MNDREKLISMIQTAVGGCSRYWASVIADYLLANGVYIDDKNMERKHGQWITDDLGNVCTACGRTYDPLYDVKPRVIRQFKYCPNCGAKMEVKNDSQN